MCKTNPETLVASITDFNCSKQEEAKDILLLPRALQPSMNCQTCQVSTASDVVVSDCRHSIVRRVAACGRLATLQSHRKMVQAAAALKQMAMQAKKTRARRRARLQSLSALESQVIESIV